MKKLLLIGLLVGASFAYYNNYYTTTKGYDGSTTTYGSSTNGSTWTKTTKSNGDQYGTNKRGEYWSYDSSSGTYYNLSTGTIRQSRRRYR